MPIRIEGVHKGGVINLYCDQCNELIEDDLITQYKEMKYQNNILNHAFNSGRIPGTLRREENNND